MRSSYECSPDKISARAGRSTTTLSAAYPFLAEAGLGSAGVFVGRDLYCDGSFVFDPWVLYDQGTITAPNVVLAGIVWADKSALAKPLYTRSIPFGRRVYVPGDPKGEHTAADEAVGGRTIVMGRGLPEMIAGPTPTGPARELGVTREILLAWREAADSAGFSNVA